MCDDDNDLYLNRPIHIDLRHETERGWGGVSPTGHAGIVRRVQIHNVVARTRGRILLTSADGGRMEDIVLRDVTLHYPGVEDPEAVFALTRSAQFSNHSPEAQLARAALVADGVDRLQVHNFNLRWPESGAGPDFAAGWFRNCTPHVNAPFAKAFRGAQDWVQAG